MGAASELKWYSLFYQEIMWHIHAGMWQKNNAKEQNYGCYILAPVREKGRLMACSGPEGIDCWALPLLQCQNPKITQAVPLPVLPNLEEIPNLAKSINLVIKLTDAKSFCQTALARAIVPAKHVV